MLRLPGLGFERAERHLIGDARQPVDESGRRHLRLGVLRQQIPHRFGIVVFPGGGVLAGDGLGRGGSWLARAEHRRAGEEKC